MQRDRLVSGVRDNLNYEYSRAGHRARRSQVIAYDRIWSARRPTLQIRVDPDT